jgi:nucleotide-binding universal stress UspA family protein
MPVTVVLTTDRSERSWRIVPHAARLARATERGLVALHVMLRPAAAEVDADRAWFEHEMAATGIASELETALQHVEPHATVVVGHPRRDESLHAAILRQANEQHALALALDSRGAGLVRRVVLGSVAVELIERSHLPVLVTGDAVKAPATSSDDAGYTIVAGCDGSAASEDAVRVLGPLLHGASVRLVLVRIDEEARGEVIGPARREALEAELRRAARHLPRDVAPEFLVFPAGSAAVHNALIAVAGREGAAAIAVSTRGPSALQRSVTGSTPLALLQRSPLPVFLTHGAA